jgi:hypothetical protein
MAALSIQAASLLSSFSPLAGTDVVVGVVVVGSSPNLIRTVLVLCWVSISLTDLRRLLDVTSDYAGFFGPHNFSGPRVSAIIGHVGRKTEKLKLGLLF